MKSQESLRVKEGSRRRESEGRYDSGRMVRGHGALLALKVEERGHMPRNTGSL